MKEQARLKEEMAYMYKIGNFEVATDKSELMSSVLLLPFAVSSLTVCVTVGSSCYSEKVGPRCSHVKLVLCGKIPMAMGASLRPYGEIDPRWHERVQDVAAT